MNSYNKNKGKRIGEYVFNLGDIVGRGSYGCVYLGCHTEYNYFVAIKCISFKHLEDDQSLIDNMASEVSIMKELRHRNIVKVFDVVSTKNNLYIVQEFCKDGDLRKLIKAKGSLHEFSALNIFKDILMGYRELNKKGIVHRDLKPENIFCKDKIYKIGDFGFAKLISNVRGDFLLSSVGTPLYMSPQILQQTKYTFKSDIWSLGIILYEMICGRTPWNASNHWALSQLIQKESVKFPSNINISDSFKDFILKSLQKDEKNRLSIDDLYLHELFKDYFPNYKDEMETRNQLIISSKQKILKSLSINGLDKYEDEQVITISDFSKIANDILKNIDRETIELIFLSLDKDCNGKILCKDLLIEIKNLNFSENENNPKKMNLDELEKILKVYDDIIAKCQNMNYKEISLFDFKSNVVTFERFSFILMKINPCLSMDNLRSLYELWDSDEPKKDFESMKNWLKITEPEDISYFKNKSGSLGNSSKTRDESNFSSPQNSSNLDYCLSVKSNLHILSNGSKDQVIISRNKFENYLNLIIPSNSESSNLEKIQIMNLVFEDGFNEISLNSISEKLN